MFIFLSGFGFESRICDLILSVSVIVLTYSLYCWILWENTLGTWEWKRVVTGRTARKRGDGREVDI